MDAVFIGSLCRQRVEFRTGGCVCHHCDTSDPDTVVVSFITVVLSSVPIQYPRKPVEVMTTWSLAVSRCISRGRGKNSSSRGKNNNNNIRGIAAAGASAAIETDRGCSSRAAAEAAAAAGAAAGQQQHAGQQQGQQQQQQRQLGAAAAAEQQQQRQRQQQGSSRGGSRSSTGKLVLYRRRHPHDVVDCGGIFLSRFPAYVVHHGDPVVRQATVLWHALLY